MRTDQSRFCAACCQRFAAELDRCPTCDGDVTYDLTTIDGRKKAVRELRWLTQRQARSLDRLLAPSLRRGAVTALLITGLLMVIRMPALAAALLALALLVWALLYIRRARLETVHYTIALAEPPPLLEAHGMIEVTGTVRAREIIRAPISDDEVVAFRIVGDGPDGRVDDAAAVPFDVEDDEGERVRVDTDGAVVAIRVDEPRREVDPDGALYEFLHRRSPFRPKPGMSLAEGRLRDGDPVEIYGFEEREAVPAGYRDTDWVRVLRSGPDGALIIRSSR
jgi:hypothetical protein